MGQRCLEFRKQFLTAAPVRLTVVPTDAYKTLNSLRQDLAKQEVRVCLNVCPWLWSYGIPSLLSPVSLID